MANARSHLRRIIKYAGDIPALAFKVIAVIEVKVVVPNPVNGRVILRKDSIPTDMGVAIFILGGNAPYIAGYESQSFMESFLLRVFRQHLHAEADAKYRYFVFSNPLPDKVGETEFLKVFHPVRKSANPRQNECIAVRKFIGIV
jgi:hypothetical protein